MSDQPENLAAILAEMRDKRIIRLGDADVTRCLLLNLADRIEAAAERERDEDRQLAAIAESDEAFARCARCDRPERAPGNASALRGALRDIRQYVRVWIGTDVIDRTLAERIVATCDAALATPARNCDRFATAEDARDAVKAEFANTMLLDDREAVEQAIAYCESDQKSGIAYSDNDVLVPMLRAALAAPARNCDVGTAEEQAKRHASFCAAHYKANDVDAQCFGCPASDKKETDCEFVWGQLPFAPAEGGKE